MSRHTDRVDRCVAAAASDATRIVFAVVLLAALASGALGLAVDAAASALGWVR